MTNVFITSCALSECERNIYNYYTFDIQCGANSTYAYFTTKNEAYNRGFEVEFERSKFSTKVVKRYEQSTNIKRSDILSYGDYKLYLREEKGRGEEAQEFSFRGVVIHNSQVNTPINKNEYKRFS